MFKIGDECNWKNQSERLVYLGHNWSGNGHWHQFARVESPNKVWCEVLTEDLKHFEMTPLPEDAANGFKAGEMAAIGSGMPTGKSVNSSPVDIGLDTEMILYDGPLESCVERTVAQYKQQRFPNRCAHKKNSRKK